MQTISIVVLLIVGLVSIVEPQSISTCGGNGMSLSSFSLRPNPINRPTVLYFDIVADILRDLNAPIPVSIKLETRFLLFWVTAPCENGVGSCSYNSWCELCLTCPCSYPTGRHTLGLSMNVTTAVPAGEYRATISFGPSGSHGCFYIQNIRVN